MTIKNIWLTGKHIYRHKPFKCLTCGNTIHAIGLWGYCKKCEANYLMLDEDYDNTIFANADPQRKDIVWTNERPTYFHEYAEQDFYTYKIEDDKLTVHKREDVN